MNLDEWQKQFIDADASRKAIVGARQCGKSTAVAGLAVHRMLTQPESSVVVVSSSDRQSAILVEKCKWMLRKLGFQKLRGDGTNPGSVRLPNGSTIVGLPCSARTIRGFSANLLVIDEAAYLPDKMYVATRPMLAATGGDLVVMSTAGEPAGFFWEVMTRERGANWARTTIRAADVSRFSKEFLAEERRELGEDAYAQEYECQFGDSENGVFVRRTAERALKDDVPPLFSKR
jgi:hypothetical protein